MWCSEQPRVNEVLTELRVNEGGEVGGGTGNAERKSRPRLLMSAEAAE